MSNNSIYYESIRRRLKELKQVNIRKCNVSKREITRTLKVRYTYSLDIFKRNTRKEEQRRSTRKVDYLMGHAKRRYNILIRDAVKSVRGEEKLKFKKKLRRLKNSFQRL